MKKTYSGLEIKKDGRSMRTKRRAIPFSIFIFIVNSFVVSDLGLVLKFGVM